MFAVILLQITAYAGEKNFSVDYINNHPRYIVDCLTKHLIEKGYQTGPAENDSANIMREMTVYKNGQTAGVYWIDKARVGAIGRSVNTHQVQDWAHQDMDDVLHMCRINNVLLSR